MGPAFRIGFVWCVAACGHVVPQAPDGGGTGDGSVSDSGNVTDSSNETDGGVDAPSNVRGTVRVTVLDRSGNGAPAVGVPVVFIDPDGTLVKTASADSNGKADADVLPGGSVTTVVALTSSYQIRTTLGIKPGDDLVLGSRSADTTAAGNVTVSWPQAPGSPAFYYIYGPCGFATLVNGSTLAATMPITNGCKPDTTEILVWARDSAGGTVSFNDKANVPLVIGGTVTMANAWTGSLSFTASYTNLTSIGSITAERRFTDGAGFASSDIQNTIGLSSKTFNFLVPSGATARMVSTLGLSSGATQTVRQKLPGNASTYGLDVGGTLLAWLDGVTFDAATQTFHILKTTAGTANAVPDLLQVSSSWQRGQTFYDWAVFGPDADTFQLPVLPASVGTALNPTASDSMSLAATSYEADTVAGYDAARANVGGALSDTLSGPRSAATLIRISSSPTGD